MLKATSLGTCCKPYIRQSESNHEDYSVFKVLYPDIGIDGPLPSFEAWKSSYQPTMSLIYLEGDEANPVGYLSPRSYNKNYYLFNLAIVRERRGQGIGTQVMHQVVEQARAQGHTILSLDCDVTHTEVYKFYTRLGFERQDRLFTYTMAFNEFNALDLGHLYHGDRGSPPVRLVSGEDIPKDPAFLARLDTQFGCFDGYHERLFEPDSKLPAFLVYDATGVHCIGSLITPSADALYVLAVRDHAVLDMEQIYSNMVIAAQMVLRGRAEGLVGQELYLWTIANEGLASRFVAELGG